MRERFAFSYDFQVVQRIAGIGDEGGGGFPGIQDAASPNSDDNFRIETRRLAYKRVNAFNEFSSDRS